MTTPDTWDAATVAYEKRTALELDLIGSILAKPSKGIEECESVGFNCDAIEHDDLRLMYVCAEEFRNRGRSTVVRVIKRALCTSGYWDSSARSFDRGHKWSDESLASLACSYPSAVQTKHLATRLMRLDETMRAAQQHYAESIRLLREAV